MSRVSRLVYLTTMRRDGIIMRVEGNNCTGSWGLAKNDIKKNN